MPPEQARGEPVDERADVYALGAMLARLLAGALLHSGTTLQEALVAAATQRPEPVEAREPGVSGYLIAMVAKAMEPEAAPPLHPLRRRSPETCAASRRASW